MEDIRREMAELQEDVVFLGTDTSSLSDLKGHGSGDDISRSQVLGSRGVSLHESFTLRVEEVTTFTSGSCSLPRRSAEWLHRNMICLADSDSPSVIKQPAP